MRPVRTLSFVLGFLALIAFPVSGQDIAGTWVLSVDLGPGGGGDATFVFEQEGTSITGTYTGTLGDGVEVSGTLEDGEITFSFESEAGEILYTCTVEGNTMSGTCFYGFAGDGTFEGTKSG